MTSSDPQRTLPGIDAPRVTEWIEGHVAGSRPPFLFELIPAGHSNITFKVTDARGERYVLRRPPLGAVLATAHDMGREYKIISALGPTRVPVPPALGLCTDETVNGAPFYVMGFVDGHVLVETADSERHFSAAERRSISESLIQVLADLHAVDPDAVGLGDLGKKEAYIARQIKRWRKQWEGSKTRELEAMETVAVALESHMPEQIGATVVHGDFRLGNCITGPDARIAAVLDWELCTLGDSMADVGYILNDWVEPGEAPFGSLTRPGPSAAAGLPAPRRDARRLPAAVGSHRAQRRLLPRLPVLAARRHRRGRVGALPQGRHGQGGRHRRHEEARREPGQRGLALRKFVMSGAAAVLRMIAG